MSRPRRILVQANPLRVDAIRSDTPLRLDVAAALAYPDGSMTSSGLRREVKRGRLVIERTAGKDYTTLAAIERMRELRRVAPKEPDYISRPSAATPPVPSHTSQSGKSETANIERAQAALNMTLLEQRRHLSATSTASIRSARAKENVVPLK
jgi:hypothetical protein